MKLTFSARLNDDGSWRGLAWNKSHTVRNPLVLVGISGGEEYWTRKEAIAAARAEAIEKGLIQDERPRTSTTNESQAGVRQARGR